MTRSAYRCARAAFTEAAYRSHFSSFAPVSNDWFDRPSPFMAELWTRGRAGAVSLLPMLLRMAQSRSRNNAAFSREELSRLCGCDGKTIDVGRRVLEEMGLASSSVQSRYGKNVLHWCCGPSLSARKCNGRFEDASSYYYFPLRFVYGGHWAQLSPPQRWLLLIIGTRARSITDEKAASALLRERLASDVAWAHVQHSWSRSETMYGKPQLRVAASLSLGELAKQSGLSPTAVSKAVGGWKPPEIWDASSSDPTSIRHSPIWVYPVRGGNHLYHIRDEVEPWPWHILNGESLPSRVVNSEASVEPTYHESEDDNDDDLPF
jgi:hypothetical protein